MILYGTMYDTLYGTMYDTLYGTMYGTLYDTLYGTMYDTLYGTMYLHVTLDHGIALVFLIVSVTDINYVTQNK